MGKQMYLDLEWTTARISKACMNVKIKNHGAGDFESITVPEEMWDWLHTETGERQSSYIVDSQWWWDKTEFGDEFVTFFFKNPDVALKFKLTFGVANALSA